MKINSFRCLIMGFGGAVFAVLLWSPPAYAYLDPGSGSFFIQMLMAALIAVPLTFRTILKKTLSWIGSVFKKKHKPEPPSSKQ